MEPATQTFCKHVEATETHRMLRGRLGLGFAHRQTQVAKLASTCLSDPSLHGIVLWLGRRCSYYVQSRSTRSKRSPQAGRYEAHSKISFRLIAKISQAKLANSRGVNWHSPASEAGGIGKSRRTFRAMRQLVHSILLASR